jgi:sugar phosphate isomerase/epimerase
MIPLKVNNNNHMKRRDFTRMAGLGVLAMHTVPTFAMSQKSPMAASKIPLGLCNHSLRSLRLNAKQLIEYVIEQKLDSVLLNTFQPFGNLEAAHLAQISKMAKLNEVSIYIGIGSISEKSTKFTDKYGNAEELLIEGIRVASAVGSPVVACRIGAIEDRYIDGGIEVHIEAVVKVMKSMRSRAQDAGIKFAFENHVADLRSSELLGLINETGTDICGALFDPANALWAMEDPMQALKNLGSNIICTSVRDVEVWETEEGATFQGMAIGEGLMDYSLYAKTLADLCPGVPLHVESISNSARSIPYLNSEFWTGFPNLPAAEIVDFLKLVKKGNPQEIVKASAGINQKEFDIKLQQAELLSSFKYLRKYCNAGLKG